MMTLAHSAVLREQVPEIGAAQSVFEDQFLFSWISDCLGTSEIRPLLLLAMEQTVDVIPPGAVNLIKSEADHVVEGRLGQVIGIWGLNGLTHDTPAKILKITDRLCGQHGVRCLLHVSVTEVDRQKDDFTESEQSVVLTMARMPFGRGPMLGISLSQPLLSEAFRDFCGLTAGLLPVSTMSDSAFSAEMPTYLLADWDASLVDASLVCVRSSSSSALSLAALLDGLGDLRPVVLAAAVAGFKFSEFVLAGMLHIESKRLRPALEALCKAGLISRTSSSGLNAESADEYQFNSQPLHDAAYNSVPTRCRLKLHRLAAASEPHTESAPKEKISKPDEIARHYQLARNSRQSMRWLSKAAWQAITRGDINAGIEHLQEALAERLGPGDSSSLRRTLLQLLGIQLAVTKGSGSDAVFETYLQSIAVAGEADGLAWGQQFRSLWLAQTCHAVKGEVRAALTIGNLLLNQLSDRGAASESALGRRILCQRVQALSLMLGGRLQDSIALYDAVIGNYRQELHAVLRFAYGSDQLALAHAHKAWGFAIIGDAVKSCTSAQLARRTAERVEHPHTSAHVLGVLGLAALTAGRIDEAILITREARTISIDNNFEYWLPWCDVVLSACYSRQSPRTGYDQLKAAMEQYQKTDAAQLCPFIFAELSKAARRDKRPDQALQDANAGISLSRLNGCVLYRPELQRQRAHALLLLDDIDAANDAFETGYDEAIGFGANKFADQIARDGMRLTYGHNQLVWQNRYHAALKE